MMVEHLTYDEYIVKNIFGVSIPRQFNTYKEQLEYITKESLSIDTDSKQECEKLSKNIDVILGNSTEPIIPSRYLDNPKRRDTSLGGNNAINCYPQFHENDDIIYPFTALDKYGDNGLGRVYNETIDSNQQIMYMSFGVAKYVDPVTFFSTSINPSLSNLMKKGDQWSIPGFFRLLGSSIGFIISLPLKPFIYTYKLLEGWYGNNATRYYDFKPTMPLYYKIVNTALATLAVNMNLYDVEEEYSPEAKIDTSAYSDDYGAEVETDTTTKNKSINQINEDGRHIGDSNSTLKNGLPAAFSTHGLDIFAILQKTEIYDRLIKNGDITSLDDEIEKIKEYTGAGNSKSSFWKNFATGFATATSESKLYVGFKIEKSTDSSESYSNSIGKSSLAESLESKTAAIRDLKSSAGGIENIPVIGTVLESLKGFLNGLTSRFGIGGISETLIGNGYLDFPEVWKNSSFSKSYNFTIQLRSIYGDRVSILYNIYIPLLMIFAAALPRAVGRNAYTSPFLVRCYSKGLFSVPLGIIDSLSVKRGSAEFGWSYENFPTAVDVTFSIKDLASAMFMGVSGTKSWLEILGQSSSFNEYLLNLGGVSLRDRSLFWRNARRKTRILNLITRNVKANPTLLGFSFGTNSFVGKVTTAINPISKLPSE